LESKWLIFIYLFIIKKIELTRTRIIRKTSKESTLFLTKIFQARADIQKAKWRLQKELDEAKRELDFEKQLRADAENTKKMLQEQLREIFALVYDDDYGNWCLSSRFSLLSLCLPCLLFYSDKLSEASHTDEEENAAIYQIESELGKLVNFKRKIEQDRANFREKIVHMEEEREELLDQKVVAEEELVEMAKKLRKAEEERAELMEEAAEMVAKVKRMEEEMARKIEATRRKIDGEIGRKAEIEGEAERLRIMQVSFFYSLLG
jgi:hypothetical protein